MKNIFNCLFKLSDEQVKEVEKEMSADDSYMGLPSGIVTDGFGNLYKIPATGKTAKTKVGTESFDIWYDWELKAIFISDGESTVDFALSPESFIDNPDYWFNVAYENLKNELF